MILKILIFHCKFRCTGNNYLKPYVSAVPEVTVTARSEDDECLILASDGLWDVVPNDTACDVARMCLRTQSDSECGGGGDKGCRDAAMLLTKLALARQSQDNVSVVVIDLKRSK